MSLNAPLALRVEEDGDLIILVLLDGGFGTKYFTYYIHTIINIIWAIE